MIDNARRRDSNLKWNDEDVDVVIQWLSIRDENDVVVNLKLYQTDNKTKTNRRFLSKTNLKMSRSDIQKKKMRDKIEQMIRHFRAIKQMTETTEWEVNVIKHDVVIENSRDMIITDVLLKKCSYYYEFEDLLEDSSIITSSFVLESTRLVFDEEEDAKNSKNETKNETDKKNDVITRDVNDQDANWINFDMNDSDSNDSLMKNSLTLLTKTSKIKSIKRKLNDVVFIKKRFKTKKIIRANSDNDDNRIRSAKRKNKERSMTDAMIEMQKMKFVDFISQFEIEMRQRSQQHEEIMTKINETILTAKMQHEKTMMRLKIELEKTSQRSE